MPGDLASGFYGMSNPVKSALGAVNVAVPGDQRACSNGEVLGLGGLSDGALAATGVLCAVPIPVDVGQTITKVSVYVGGQAEGTGTHAFAAIYSGIAVPALLRQSTDLTGATAVGPVNARFDFTLSTPYMITATDAPNGFIYAGVAVTATTVPTVASSATPTAINYQLGANSPLFLSLTAGSALGATAAATIASPAAKAVAPIITLS